MLDREEDKECPSFIMLEFQPVIPFLVTEDPGERSFKTSIGDRCSISQKRFWSNEEDSNLTSPERPTRESMKQAIQICVIR